MWIYLYVVAVIAVAYFVGQNAKNKGYFFWRSFIFILLLGAMVLAFLAKQFNG